MHIFTRFQAIDENYKSSVVRRLIQSGTPDFDFFYMSGLATLMAALGLLANSPAIVIGSMLIAPVLYPVLGIAMGLVMSDVSVLSRSFFTLGKAFTLGIFLSMVAALFFGVSESMTPEILARTDATLISVMVAIIAGLAVSYALAMPEWSATLPGIAISVALIPPVAVVGIGLAAFDVAVITGSLLLLLINVVGITFAAMVSFSLMNLHAKRKIAESTIKREDERIEGEKAVMEEIENGEKLDAAA